MVALWVLSAAPVGAGEVLGVNVERFDERYVVEVDARFQASADRLRELLTDFPNLHRINASIRRSEVLEVTSPQQHRVRTEARVCVAMLCRKIVQVQDVKVLPDGNLLATILPAQSDFRYGVARWDFRSEGSATRMLFRSEIEPAFWVPPLIGPWLVRQALQGEAIKTVANVERLVEQPL